MLTAIVELGRLVIDTCEKGGAVFVGCSQC